MQVKWSKKLKIKVEKNNTVSVARLLQFDHILLGPFGKHTQEAIRGAAVHCMSICNYYLHLATYKVYDCMTLSEELKDELRSTYSNAFKHVTFKDMLLVEVHDTNTICFIKLLIINNLGVDF